MFKNPPKIFAHVASLDNGNFVLPEVILNKSENDVTLFHRFCPHRMYPLHNTGDHVQTITCKFHGFEWDKDGAPVNNDKKLKCGTASVGRSGLVFKDFIEPDHQWVIDLANEQRLEFSHIKQGKSNGSWLWMMEIQADLLHIRTGDDVVHPWLSSTENLDQVVMESGENWIIQTCSTGWWLFIYPFTFIEWSKGCLSVNYTIPNNINNEFGFEWITQFYYDLNITQQRRNTFEKLEDVFLEDVETIEMQKGNYFPLIKAMNRYEDHCVHFGKWVKANKAV
jgi:nitrite reductase/ring-hydroxylating ferredoxin subunit